MAIDPVCGIVILPENAVSCTVYKSNEYCFCSDECKEEFDENPQAYLEELDELDLEDM